MEAAFTAPIMRGLKHAAAGRVRLIVHALPTHVDFYDVCRAYPLEQLGYDAAHLAGTITFFGERPLIERLGVLHHSGHPCILVLRTGGGVPHVLPHDASAIEALVCRLHRHGHRRIMFIRGPDNNHSSDGRFAGYRRGLERMGLPFDEALVLKGDFVEQRSFRAVNDALGRNLHFTAIVSGNDLNAIGALRALKARGVSVPGQVEVVGFDNIPAAPLTEPPLTTFHLPLEDMARAAVEQMIKILHGEAVPADTYLPPHFINRATTRFTDTDPALDGPARGISRSEVLDPEVSRLLESIHSGASAEKVLSASEDIFNAATRHDIDLETVANCIAVRAGAPEKSADPDSDETGRSTLSAALALTVAATRLVQAKAIEKSQTFLSLTFRLRQLALESLDENAVIEELRATFGALGFERTRLYVNAPDSENGRPSEGDLHCWDLPDASTRKVAATSRDLQPTALELSAHSPVVFVLPMIADRTIIGNIITDGGSRFSNGLADLVRNVTGALHTVRLYRDLARINEELRGTQRELIEVSRLAGVAEVAVGVLHNIGNALNSVNVSAGVITDKLHTMKIESVGKIGQLLVRDTEVWHRHFTEDERGRKVADYVLSLGENLEQSRAGVLGEVKCLREGVEHLNQIVASQQQFAQVSGIVENVDPAEPIEYALRLCEGELLRHHIAVVRDYHPVPKARLDSHKVVQIFVNLIRNAKDSLASAQTLERQIRVGIRRSPDGRTQCYVTDNGAGIAPESLSRLFTMGFSTKEGGHGFGLHNSALTASSLGGSLSAESDGPGLGATFIFTLPAADAAAS